jgi:glycosyltransferase involved in cell wall biosynthesis
MFILLINQFYTPDPAPTGQLLSHVADALAAAGHDVKVVCARQSYVGAGRVGLLACPRAEGARESYGGSEGLHVHRVPCARFGHGHAARLLSYASFYAGVLRHVLTGPRPDLVLTLTTPPLLSLAGTVAKRLRGARHVIWEMDVYPDVAVALSVIEKASAIERLIGALADFSRRGSDAVIALGPCMRDLLAARGIPLAKLHIAENWVDSQWIAPQPFPQTAPLTTLYSGNFGLAHDSETIAAAISRLSDPRRFQFVFAGGGPRRKALESRCRALGTPNVAFLPYQDAAGLALHFGNCHAGLVTQNPATCGTLVPSKMYAFLAAGRPFIFVGPPAATPARVIERYNCGWQVDPGDAGALTSLLELLAAQPDIARQAGGRARHAFLQHYDRAAGVSRVLQILGCAPVVRSHPVEAI